MAEKISNKEVGNRAGDVESGGRTINYSLIRLSILTGAFLIILINPFLNYYLHLDFIQGWYQSLGIGKLWFVSPLEGLESLLVTKSIYMPSIIGMLIPLFLALMLGRVFCSWICPITFLLEIVDRIRLRIAQKKYLRDRFVLAKQLLWYSLLAELLLSMILGAPIFVFMSPPGLIGREIMMWVFFAKFALEGVILFAVLALELVTRRCYCRYFCPLGALLAFIGVRRKLKVQRVTETCTGCRRCDLVCPMGISPSTGESESAYCWNCGSCVDHCRDASLHFGWKKN